MARWVATHKLKTKSTPAKFTEVGTYQDSLNGRTKHVKV